MKLTTNARNEEEKNEKEKKKKKVKENGKKDRKYTKTLAALVQYKKVNNYLKKHQGSKERRYTNRQTARYEDRKNRKEKINRAEYKKKSKPKREQL